MPPPATAETPRPRVGQADAWLASPAADTSWRERLEALDAEERRRLAAIVEPTTARAYAVLHLLARDVLGRLVGSPPSDVELDRTCARCGGQHGPPRVVGHPQLHVSLSRTPDLVAVAVSADAPVGVDVERVAGTGFAGFDAVATHPSELAAGIDDHARAVSWVRKEAALKALGVGFVVDPATLATPQPGRADIVLPGRPAVSVVDLALDDDGHVAALGLAAAYGEVQVTVHPRA
ncbi:4'-phosphopantetheinyl transferase family protein [Humibacillus xanthopallidus]|uniref:4'-phosphopantetheinyl transferase family protein n=1 Tax=Humibacillus xanthopallidus TaxID=412689 RepID=UPI00384E58A1